MDFDEDPIVRIVKGPGMISLGFMMILALAVVMGALMAIWPTAPPAASLAGPEAEARAMAAQSSAALVMAIVSGLALAALFRIRTVTFDFNAKTLRIVDARAVIFRSDRTIPFDAIAAMRRHERWIGTYIGWVMRVHFKAGGSVLLGPWAPEPGLLGLIKRVMPERSDAQGAD